MFHGHDCNDKYFNAEKMKKDFEREEYLKSLGFQTLFIYQCDFNKMMSKDNSLRKRFFYYYHIHKKFYIKKF